MEGMAKTIDNLGVDISSRYAADREIYEESLIKEARLIPHQTRIAATLPSYTSEFDTLFELGQKRALWANFRPPPNYYASRRRLFAEQLIPYLGAADLRESKLERIEAIGKEAKKKKHSLPKEEGEVEKEQQILKNLLQHIHLFDQLLIDINSRRAQYQKG